MSDTMQFDLVAPERRLASLQATEVQIPGAEGDMTAMPNHAPLITTLRPGVLTVNGPDGEARYVVTGGFAEINAEGMSVLAERAIPAAEVTSDMLQGFIDEANAAAENAADDAKDAAAKTAADMAMIAEAISV